MRKTKRIGIALAALALMAVLPLGIVADAAAEYTPVDYDSYIVWDELEGIPDDLTLVTEDLRTDLDSEGAYKLVFGKDGAEKIDQAERDIMAELGRLSELDISEDEKEAMMDAFYDEYVLDLLENKLGYWADADTIVDLHLEDAQHNKVPYDGDEITIVFDKIYELDPVGSDMRSVIRKSDKEWEYAELHIKDDGTREFLPITIDNDTGKGTFKTTSFSTFIPVYRVIKEEEEAPKTLDNTNVSVGAAVIGVVGLLTLGLFITRKERR